MAVSLARARALLVALAIGAPVSAVAQQDSSLTLAALLDRVKTGHPHLGAAEARVAAAQAARRAAGVFPNPVLGFNLENATIPGRPRPSWTPRAPKAPPNGSVPASPRFEPIIGLRWPRSRSRRPKTSPGGSTRWWRTTAHG